jgi:hypothetical protein
MKSYIAFGKFLVETCYYLEGDGVLMPFAYDIIRNCVSKFHLNQVLPVYVSTYINEVSTILVTAKGKTINHALKKQCIEKVQAIKKAVYKFLEPKVSSETVVNTLETDEGLKDKGLLYTMNVLKFCRFWDASRATQLLSGLASLKPYRNLIHTVDDSVLESLASEVQTYLELCKDLVFTDKPYQIQGFFESNKKLLPNFAAVFRLIALFNPSNACSERLNSVFTLLEYDKTCLLETVQSGTIMRYNHRKVIKRHTPINVNESEL